MVVVELAHFVRIARLNRHSDKRHTNRRTQFDSGSISAQQWTIPCVVPRSLVLVLKRSNAA